MNHLLLAGAAALAMIAVTGAAQAVDVVNEDDLTYELNVITDTSATTIEIKAGEQVEAICEKCSLSVGDGEELEFEGDEVVFIRDGKMEHKVD